MNSKEEYIKMKINDYYKNKYKQKFVVKKYEEKRKIDIMDRIIDNLARRANVELKKKNIKRKLTHMQLIGCTKDELKIYLQNKFIENMSFENYGTWEVDHIYPISRYEFNNLEDIKNCFNYKNLQPLYKSDNHKKYNKILYAKPNEVSS